MPDKKVVEYKLTPEDGYIIDELWVNKDGTDAKQGSRVIPTTAKLDAEGKPEYYTYKFEASDIKDQAIHVTWQKAKSLKVEKTWKDDGDWKDETRPSSLTIELQDANGNSYKGHNTGVDKVAENGNNYDPTRTMTGTGDTWTYTFKNLPHHDKDGNTIKYKVVETKLDTETAPYTYTPRYDAAVDLTGDETTYTIDNTLKKAPLKVTKSVVNDDNPASVAFDFTATLTGSNTGNTYTGTVAGVKDGETKTIEFSAGSSQMITEVPVGIAYSVVEDDGKGYKVTYASESGTVAEGGSTATATNTAPSAEVTVTKKWNDNNNQDGLRPKTADEIKAMFTLYKKVGSGPETAVTNADPTVTEQSDGSYTVKWTDLKKLEGGQEITYTVKETTPPDKYEPVGGEDVALTKTTDSTTKNDTYAGEITNKHEPYTTKLKVVKTWDDTSGDLFKSDGSAVADYERPTLTVKVKGVYDDAGTEKTAYDETTITLTGETRQSVTTWTSEEMKDLPVFWDGGKPVTYKVTETVPDAYTGTKASAEVTPKLNTAGDAYECDDATLTNTPIEQEKVEDVELLIKKVDARSEETGLAGAVFTVTPPEGAAYDVTETDKDGITKCTFSAAGTYTIKEKTPPAGFEADTTEYSVVVEKGEIVRVTKQTGFWEKLYNYIFDNATKAKLKDGTTLIVKNEPIPEERTVTRMITYKYIDENGNEAVQAVVQPVKITRLPQVDPATGKASGWTDWEASDSFPAVTSPTYDATSASTKGLKGWTPEKDSPQISQDTIASTVNGITLPANYDTMSDADKDAFWQQASKDNFSEEVYYQIDPAPEEDGGTSDELYDEKGNIKSQKWTPSDDFKKRITDYAVLPDGQGTPNEILGYTLLDGNGNEVTRLTVAGEGTYVIDPNTGEVTFTPVAGFSGTATGVTVRVIDMLGREYGVDYPTAVYTPIVIKNTPPQPDDPVKPDKKKSSSKKGVKAGDETDAILWLMMMLSVGAAAVITVRRRRSA